MGGSSYKQGGLEEILKFDKQEGQNKWGGVGSWEVALNYYKTMEGTKTDCHKAYS